MSSDWKIYGIYEEGNDECIYIGRTSMSLENRWFYHSWKGNKKGGSIWRYMQEQGVEKFRIELLVTCQTRQDWCDWETHLILDFQPKFNKRFPTLYS